MTETKLEGGNNPEKNTKGKFSLFQIKIGQIKGRILDKLSEDENPSGNNKEKHSVEKANAEIHAKISRLANSAKIGKGFAFLYLVGTRDINPEFFDFGLKIEDLLTIYVWFQQGNRFRIKTNTDFQKLVSEKMENCINEDEFILRDFGTLKNVYGIFLSELKKEQVNQILKIMRGILSKLLEQVNIVWQYGTYNDKSAINSSLLNKHKDILDMAFFVIKEGKRANFDYSAALNFLNFFIDNIDTDNISRVFENADPLLQNTVGTNKPTPEMETRSKMGARAKNYLATAQTVSGTENITNFESGRLLFLSTNKGSERYKTLGEVVGKAITPDQLIKVLKALTADGVNYLEVFPNNSFFSQMELFIKQVSYAAESIKSKCGNLSSKADNNTQRIRRKELFEFCYIIREYFENVWDGIMSSNSNINEDIKNSIYKLKRETSEKFSKYIEDLFISKSIDISELRDLYEKNKDDLNMNKKITDFIFQLIKENKIGIVEPDIEIKKGDIIIDWVQKSGDRSPLELHDWSYLYFMSRITNNQFSLVRTEISKKLKIDNSIS